MRIACQDPAFVTSLYIETTSTSSSPSITLFFFLSLHPNFCCCFFFKSPLAFDTVLDFPLQLNAKVYILTCLKVLSLFVK